MKGWLKMSDNIDNVIKNFLLNEYKEPDLLEYLNVISEMLSNFKPQRESDKGRLSVMQENLRKARRKARMMQERLSVLEEQVKIIEENKEDE